jgi:RNA polymerase sigma-70 factor (ECF subfamily)
MTTPDPAALERDVAAALAAKDWTKAATLGLRGHGQGILLYLRGVLRDPDLADDAFSHFSEKLWRSMDEFRGESTFQAWAYRLAWYTTKEIKRGLARRRERRVLDGELSQVAAQVRDSTALFLRTAVKDRWAELRESLDPEERSLLLLRVERRLPWKEIAAIMAEDGTPTAEAALRKRFERLRTKLHQLFKDHGLR